VFRVIVSPFPVGEPAAAYFAARNGVNLPAVESAKLTGSRVAERSLPIDALDVEAARAASLYLAPAEARGLNGQPAAELVGRLSDSFFGRYGVTSISPSVLALWQETCSTIRNWSALSESAKQSFLGQYMAVCLVISNTRNVVASRDSSPTCIAVGDSDGITPEPMTSWLLKRWTAVKRVTYHGGHASLTGLRKCLHRS
jgi:hypothetical protein